MPILFDLPSDIALAVLMVWLGDTRSLVSLDSASARSVRCAYLGLIRHPAFAISEIFAIKDDIGVATAIRYWIGNRGVKIRVIHATAKAMKHVTLISYECLSAVSSLILTCHYTEPVIDLESFAFC